MSRRTLWLVGVSLLIGGGLSAVAVDLALEAEFPSEIAAPMIVDTPSNASALGPVPSDASRGKFVWLPGAPATGGTDGTGYVRYRVNIPRAGKYAVWGRVLAWDGNSDSFWVTINPPDTDPNPQQSGDTHFRWGVAQGSEWHWDRVNQWLDGGTFEREWDLPQGEVVITFFAREDGTMLDAIYITDNLGTDEADVNPRLPTDQEVANQMGGAAAVEPTGKLALRWAELKR
ncbi:MAG: hypothetical protein KatS3mg115_1080 [Candidatus Poribacteria bacterium]|nr:MAG: hypothetical protein KatS3mg115_1080 [Candidatus Poribacteria bacterium]